MHIYFTKRSPLFISCIDLKNIDKKRKKEGKTITFHQKKGTLKKVKINDQFKN